MRASVERPIRARPAPLLAAEPVSRSRAKNAGVTTYSMKNLSFPPKQSEGVVTTSFRYDPFR